MIQTEGLSASNLGAVGWIAIAAVGLTILTLMGKVLANNLARMQADLAASVANARADAIATDLRVRAQMAEQDKRLQNEDQLLDVASKLRIGSLEARVQVIEGQVRELEKTAAHNTAWVELTRESLGARGGTTRGVPKGHP